MVTFYIAIAAIVAASIFSLTQQISYDDGCLSDILGFNFARQRDRRIYWFLLAVAEAATLFGCVLHFGVADLSVWKSILAVLFSILLGVLGPLLAVAIIRLIIRIFIVIIEILK